MDNLNNHDNINEHDQENEVNILKEELEQYKKERESIKKLVGQIGGKDSLKQDHIVNIIFIIGLCFLFFLDLIRSLTHINIPIPHAFSIELGVLMISIKIIWMIHKQTKVEHFQFWILNSIEFRLNNISKKILQIEKQIRKTDTHRQNND